MRIAFTGKNPLNLFFTIQQGIESRDSTYKLIAPLVSKSKSKYKTVAIMSGDYGSLLGALDGPNETYSPYNRISPYPKFLVVNIYGGYSIVSDRLICIGSLDQMIMAQKLKSTLAQKGIEWHIQLNDPTHNVENVGLQLEIKPLKYDTPAYEMEIEIFDPYHKAYQNGIISLIATDLPMLEKGIDTLIQAIQLSIEIFGPEMASMWIQDW